VPETVGALDYHRLTVHRPDRTSLDDPRLVRGFRPLRWDVKPPQFKTYPGLAAERLPDEIDPHGTVDRPAMNRYRLGRLLHLSAGVVRSMPLAGGPMWFRAAGSAGNLSPVEVYVVTGDLPGVAAGVYHYEPVAHALVRLGGAPADTGPALVLTGVPWRTCWKYRERGFRHLWWDAGTMLAHVLAVAGADGHEARVTLGFVDAEVAALVGADGVHEVPLAVVGLDGPADLPAPDEGTVAAGHLADDPFEFPLVTAAFRAGELADAGAVAEWRDGATGAGWAPPAAGPGFDLGAPIDEVILRRGSARRFDPSAVARPSLLSEALPWAVAPAPLDVAPAGATLLEHLLLVHAEEGTDPGAYRLGLDGPEELGVGDLRAVGRHLCLDQPLGGDGVLTAFHCADLDRLTATLGDRGYRVAQLEAGVVEGRLHLAAYAMGLGATGLTFYDEEVSRFFVTVAAPMLVTAVGRPPYRWRPGGPPRRPTVIRPG
jgi:nitroreductase